MTLTFRPLLAAIAITLFVSPVDAKKQKSAPPPPAACSDFYTHVNTPWLRSNPLPPGYASRSLWDEMNELAARQREALFSTPQKGAGPAQEKLNALMQSACANRGVLHYCANDVLDLDSMLESLKSIDTDMPFTIVTEGLLLYFTINELRQFLSNIFTLLSRGRNTTWITDLVTKENLNELCTSHPEVSRSVRKVFEMTGRTIIASNPFQSEACVQRYLNEFGLRVNRTVALRDVASRLDLSIATAQSIRERVVGSRKIWSISVNK